MGSNKSIKKFYEKGYIKVLNEQFLWNSPSETFSWYRMKKAIAQFFLQEIKKLKGKRIEVLDMGCGTGTDIFVLNSLSPKNANISFIGIDFSSIAVKQAKKIAEKNKLTNCSFLVGNAETKYLGKKFDIIISSEVIEHLPNPTKHIKNIAKHLKEKGILVISTPNESNLPRTIVRKILPKKIEKKLRKKFEENSLLVKDEAGFEFHISLQSFKSLCNLLKKNGFKIEKFSRGSILYGGEWIDRNSILLSCLMFFDSIIPKSIFPNMGWDMVLKARKEAK